VCFNVLEWTTETGKLFHKAIVLGKEFMYLLVAMMLSGCNNWTRQLVSLRLVSAKHVDSAERANKHEGILVCHTLFYPDCPSSQFQCATSGRCVSSTLRCNGIRTCNDGSDEMNCSELY